METPLVRARVRRRRAHPVLLLCASTMCVTAWLHGCGWAYSCTAKGCAHNGLRVDITTMDGSPLTGKDVAVELQSSDREFDDVCDFDPSAPTGCAFGQFS